MNLQLKSFQRLFIFTILFFGIFWLAKISQAATYTCGTNGVDNSCTPSIMATIINSAVDGDIIYVASGTHNWGASGVTVNKSLTITGNGSCTGCGTASPSGTWPATINLAVSSSPSIGITSASTTDVIRITGLHFTGTAPGGTSAVGAVRVNSTNLTTSVRVDNCKFETTGNSYANNGASSGLVDHNWFASDGCNSDAAIMLRDVRTSNQGGWAWTQDLSWGSANFLFIEDNTFTGTCTAEGANLYLWVQGGGQWVLRYNYIQGRFAKVYGNWAYIYRSGVAFEAYNNTMIYPNDTNEKVFQVEGGSCLVHDNTTIHYSSLTNVVEQRVTGARGDNFGQCNGTHPWDGNWSSKSNTDCTDLYTPYSCCTAYHAGTCGDISYPVGYPCLDQIGRGKTASADYYSSPYAQPQQPRPVRVWNNTHSNGTWHGDANLWPLDDANWIVENRDYYTCSDNSCSWVAPFLASYKPYTYPHPLQGGGDTTPPSAPTGVTVN